MISWAINELVFTESTNDDAKKAAENGAAQGTVFWALQQKAGRGRHGRAWESPEGNLYFSMILRPKVSVSEWGKYGMLASLAVAEALQLAEIQLKWPNDVLVRGKKISGILLEAGEGWLVIGIGINVASCPAAPLYPATCIAEECGSCQLKSLLLQVLEAVSKWSDLFDLKGFACVRDAWLGLARKGDMRVRLPQGEISGRFAGVDDNGNLLLLAQDGGKRVIHTADVFFV